MRRPITIAACIAGFFVVAGAATFFGTAAVVLPACATTDGGGFTPITGIEVLSDTLTAGHGCGTGPTQVFKYVVVVQVPSDFDGGQDGGQLAGDLIATGVYDCFANATLANLCTYGTSGSSTYSLNVYAFTEAQWSTVASRVSSAVGSGISLCSALDASSASKATAPGSGADGILAPLATWSTTCIATQQLNIPVVAQCGLLEPVVLADAQAPDGAAADAGDAQVADATDQMDAESGPDAADASDGDAAQRD